MSVERRILVKYEIPVERHVQKHNGFQDFVFKNDNNDNYMKTNGFGRESESSILLPLCVKRGKFLNPSLAICIYNITEFA